MIHLSTKFPLKHNYFNKADSIIFSPVKTNIVTEFFGFIFSNIYDPAGEINYSIKDKILTQSVNLSCDILN